jgi:hypothetical protein
VAAFCVLAAAGLPVITRYLLLTATLMAIFAGAGAFGWLDLRAGSPQRTWWARFGALALIALVVFVPDQVRRVERLRDALSTQKTIQGRLAAVVRPQLPCLPAAVPNRRPIPLLALWLKLDPGVVADAQSRLPVRGTYLIPATATIAREYILDRRDRDKRVLAPPQSFERVRANDAWIVAARC